MGTSCVALSIKNIKTRASREMTRISDCLEIRIELYICYTTGNMDLDDAKYEAIGHIHIYTLIYIHDIVFGGMLSKTTIDPPP